MFTDMTISTDLNSKFDDFLKKEKLSLGVNFSILVLQVGEGGGRGREMKEVCSSGTGGCSLELLGLIPVTQCGRFFKRKA